MTETIGIDIKVNSQVAEKEINGINQALLSIGKAGAALVTLDKIKDIGIYAAKTADQFTALEGRLADTMQGFGNLETAMQSIKRISSETGAGIQTVGKLFENVAESARNAGRSSADAEKLVETLSRIKTAYNIDDVGFSNAMLQFNQALSAGVLRGEEFNSVMENASPVMRAMAASLGVNVGHMRQLAEAGALTTDKIFMLTTQLESVTTKMENAPKTISTEWGKLVSEFDQSFIALNNNFKITEKIANLIGWAAEKVRDLREEEELTVQPQRKTRPWGADTNVEKVEEQRRRKKQASLASIEAEEQNLLGMAEQDALSASQNANFEKLMSGAKATGKTKSAEQLASEQQRKNDELNALAEQGEQAKRDQLAQRRAEELQKLEEHKQAELEIYGRYSGMMQEIHFFRENSIDKMDDDTKKTHISRLKNFGLQTLNEAGNYSKKLFEISKAANLADAIVQGYGAVQKALNSAPPPINFGLAGLVAAQTAVQVRGIRAQKYGGGGSFTPATGGGGASSQGFGAISEKFSDKSESKPQKQVNITIADGDIFSAKSVRELIKAIGEEVGNNLVLTTG